MANKIKKSYKRFIWRQFMKHFSHKILHFSASQFVADDVPESYATTYARRDITEMLVDEMIEKGVVEIEKKALPEAFAHQHIAHVYILKK